MSDVKTKIIYNKRNALT